MSLSRHTWFSSRSEWAHLKKAEMMSDGVIIMGWRFFSPRCTWLLWETLTSQSLYKEGLSALCSTPLSLQSDSLAHHRRALQSRVPLGVPGKDQGVASVQKLQEWRGLVKKRKPARMQGPAADLIFTDETFQPSGAQNVQAEVYREMKDGARQNKTNKRPQTIQMPRMRRLASFSLRHSRESVKTLKVKVASF